MLTANTGAAQYLEEFLANCFVKVRTVEAGHVPKVELYTELGPNNTVCVSLYLFKSEILLVYLLHCSNKIILCCGSAGGSSIEQSTTKSMFFLFTTYESMKKFISVFEIHPAMSDLISSFPIFTSVSLRIPFT